MESVKFHTMDHSFPVRVVRYDEPSPLDELKARLGRRPVTEDDVLEASLAQQIERLVGGRCPRRRQSRPPTAHRAASVAAPSWPTCMARFLVHFVKGLFFGAGVFAMDRLLYTHRLSAALSWLLGRMHSLLVVYGHWLAGVVMNLLGGVATGLTLGFFLSCGWQARAIVRSQSVGDLSFYPFAATYLNCMLWLKYGVFMGDSVLVIVNGFGALVAFCSMVTYYWYTNDKMDVEKKALQVLGIIFVIFLIVRVKLLHPKWIGLAAMFGSVIMFGAPLVALKNIIRKKDSSVLSFPTLLMSVAVSSIWTVYGTVKRDIFIFLPNFLGTLLSLAQLCIFFKYRPLCAASSASPRILGKDKSSYEFIGANNL